MAEDPRFHITVVSQRRRAQASEGSDGHRHHSSGSERHHHHSSGSEGHHHHSSDSEGHHHHSSGSEGHHHHSSDSEGHHHRSSGSGEYHRHSHSSRNYKDYGTVNLGPLTEHLDKVIDDAKAPNAAPQNPAEPAPAAPIPAARASFEKYGPILSRQYRKQKSKIPVILLLAVLLAAVGFLLVLLLQDLPAGAGKDTAFTSEEAEIIDIPEVPDD